MKILITGATGFIGSYLTKKILQDNNVLHAIVRRSSKKSNLDNRIKIFEFDNNTVELTSYMNREKFEGVIHLASLFLSSHKSEDVTNLINSNILFPTVLLEACVENDVKWFINTGTFTQHYKNKRYSPVNLYSATKQAFEDVAKYYIETSNINFVTIKLFDTFGAGDRRPKIFSLWSKMAKTKDVLDMSPGEQIIDINYVENVADGYMRMAKLLSSNSGIQFKGKTFTLSSGERHTLRQLAKIFEKATNEKLNINWGKRAYRDREVMVPWEKGNNVPGWKPKISLIKAIKKTVKD